LLCAARRAGGWLGRPPAASESRSWRVAGIVQAATLDPALVLARVWEDGMMALFVAPVASVADWFLDGHLRVTGR
jgi:hypothetical protein